MFARRGFAAASNAEIVAAARVTTGALYHHFGGKTELFRAVAESIEEQIMAAVVGAAGNAPANDPAAALRAGIEALLKLATRKEVRQIVFLDAPVALGPAVWREIEMRYAYGLMLGTLKSLEKSGRLKAARAELLTPMLLGALTEAAHAIAASDDPRTSHVAAVATVQALLDGVLAH